MNKYINYDIILICQVIPTMNRTIINQEYSVIQHLIWFIVINIHYLFDNQLLINKKFQQFHAIMKRWCHMRNPAVFTV